MSAPAVLLMGEEFLVDEALDQLRDEVGADSLSEDSFDSASEASDILRALETRSLFGGRRLVIVREADGLNKQVVDALTGYLDSPSPDAVLVLTATGKTKLESAVKKNGSVVALQPPKGRRLVGWLRERGGRRDLKIDERGAWTLIDTVGPVLRDLDAALAQLETALGPKATVGAAEVKRAFPRFADRRIYEFTDAVGDRRLPQAMTTLRRLLIQGDEPLVVFGALTGQVRRMLRARRHAEMGAAAVGAALGLPGWRAERLTRQARAYTEDELVDALGVLADADVELKGGDLPPEATLELTVVRLIEGGATRLR